MRQINNSTLIPDDSIFVFRPFLIKWANGDNSQSDIIGVYKNEDVRDELIPDKLKDDIPESVVQRYTDAKAVLWTSFNAKYYTVTDGKYGPMTSQSSTRVRSYNKQKSIEIKYPKVEKNLLTQSKFNKCGYVLKDVIVHSFEIEYKLVGLTRRYMEQYFIFVFRNKETNEEIIMRVPKNKAADSINQHIFVKVLGGTEIRFSLSHYPNSIDEEKRNIIYLHEWAPKSEFSFMHEIKLKTIETYKFEYGN